MPLFSISIFLSAFLLFQIQPMIGKAILPWFGGTPAVWSTLMLAFQVLLTGGYAYSTWLARKSNRQVYVHIALLAGAVLVPMVRWALGLSPVIPSISVDTRHIYAQSSPILEILEVLLLSSAIPFFVLSTNGPLMQAWFSRLYSSSSYARLYALSNTGSLLGLLTYPFLIEPNFSLRFQGWMWTLGFLLFGLLTGWIAFRSGRVPAPSTIRPDPVKRTNPTSPALLSLWLLLSATASLFLLSVTNQISQEVAVIPFLWILPLSIYLISFILTFSGRPGFYQRKFHALLFVLSAGFTLFVMLNATQIHVYWQILAYSLVLFEVCMLCHGELYLLRPEAEHLTTFYLMISVGGALGGIFVSLLAPLIFNGYWEFFVGLAMTVAIFLTILRSEPGTLAARARFITLVFVLVTGMLSFLDSRFSSALFAERNFYGMIRVRGLLPSGSREPAYIMSHGITVHGLQFIRPELRHLPTTYYVPGSGVGLAIQNHPRAGNSLRVGMLGVGTGTLAAYGQLGDIYRLYEINPVVIDLAQGQGGYFSFVQDSQAEVTMVAGDARISLELELARGDEQNFDVLVLDTFSSDSVPVHLVTKEALALYLAHLAPDGMIAAHITNLHLDLQPVFWQLAQYHHLSMARIEYQGDANGGYASHWILLARDPALLQIPAIQEKSVYLSGYSTDLSLWTDDYSNLFQIFK